MPGTAGLIVRSATKVDASCWTGPTRFGWWPRRGGRGQIDVDAATRRGGCLQHAVGQHLAAAEMTIALMLAVTRKVAAADHSVHDGVWDRSPSGRRALRQGPGPGGAGRIGREVAARARAFGMTVVACDPYLADSVDVDLCPLEQVLAEADVVSLHVPLNDDTRHLIDARAIASMKPGSFLINASRGGVVDEAALVEALQTGHLAGAASTLRTGAVAPEASFGRRRTWC